MRHVVVAVLLLGCSVALLSLVAADQQVPVTQVSNGGKAMKITVKHKFADEKSGGGGGGGKGGRGRRRSRGRGRGGVSKEQLKKDVMKELMKQRKATSKFKKAVAKEVMKHMKKRGGARRRRGGRARRRRARRGGKGRGGGGGADFTFLPPKRGLYVIPSKSLKARGRLGIKTVKVLGDEADSKPCTKNCQAGIDKPTRVSGAFSLTPPVGDFDNPAMVPVKGTQTVASPPVTNTLDWPPKPGRGKKDESGMWNLKPACGRGCSRRRRRKARAAKKARRAAKKAKKAAKKAAAAVPAAPLEDVPPAAAAPPALTVSLSTTANYKSKDAQMNVAHNWQSQGRFMEARADSTAQAAEMAAADAQALAASTSCGCQVCPCPKKKKSAKKGFVMQMVQPATPLTLKPAVTVPVAAVAPSLVMPVPQFPAMMAAIQRPVEAVQAQIVNCGCVVCPCPAQSAAVPLVDANGIQKASVKLLGPRFQEVDKPKTVTPDLTTPRMILNGAGAEPTMITFGSMDNLATPADITVLSNTITACGCEVCPCPQIHEVPASCGCNVCPCPVPVCGCTICPCQPSAVPFPGALTPATAQAVADVTNDCGCSVCPCPPPSPCPNNNCGALSPAEREQRAREWRMYMDRKGREKERDRLHEEMYKHQANFDAISRMSRALRFQFAELQRNHFRLQAEIKTNEGILRHISNMPKDNYDIDFGQSGDPTKKVIQMNTAQAQLTSTTNKLQKLQLCEFLGPKACDIAKLRRELEVEGKKLESANANALVVPKLVSMGNPPRAVAKAMKKVKKQEKKLEKQTKKAAAKALKGAKKSAKAAKAKSNKHAVQAAKKAVVKATKAASKAKQAATAAKSAHGSEKKKLLKEAQKAADKAKKAGNKVKAAAKKAKGSAKKIVKAAAKKVQKAAKAAQKVEKKAEKSIAKKADKKKAKKLKKKAKKAAKKNKKAEKKAKKAAKKQKKKDKKKKRTAKKARFAEVRTAPASTEDMAAAAEK